MLTADHVVTGTGGFQGYWTPATRGLLPEPAGFNRAVDLCCSHDLPFCHAVRFSHRAVFLSRHTPAAAARAGRSGFGEKLRLPTVVDAKLEEIFPCPPWLAQDLKKFSSTHRGWAKIERKIGPTSVGRPILEQIRLRPPWVGQNWKKYSSTHRGLPNLEEKTGLPTVGRPILKQIFLHPRWLDALFLQFLSQVPVFRPFARINADLTPKPTNKTQNIQKYGRKSITGSHPTAIGAGRRHGRRRA